MSANKYYIVILKDKTEHDFDKQCNSVSYQDPYFCVFKHYINSAAYETLALIPYDSIFEILKVKENDW